jgi:L-arabinokinase
MRGSDFLSRYGETDDPVTTVDPHEVYSVRGCTAYPIYETARTLKFIEHLEKARVTGEERYLVAAGKLMYAAHWGYRTLVGLGARETDLIMRLVRRRGPQKGLYGAKTSGGGSGGTMAILARADAHETIAEVADEYAHQTGLRPYVFVGTSPGTVKYGLRHIEV